MHNSSNHAFAFFLSPSVSSPAVQVLLGPNSTTCNATNNTLRLAHYSNHSLAPYLLTIIFAV
jgi:hypothetical protein